MKKFITTTLALTSALSFSVNAEEKKDAKIAEAPKVPQAFTINCAVCHALDSVVVGPSLIEIAKIYPEKNTRQFIEWCYKPGRKRPDMPNMPAQPQVSKADLTAIHEYIVSIAAGKDLRVRTKSDLYKNSPTATAKPRVTRTFLPETGPASMAIVLPTKAADNFIWDTDKCELRYVSVGKVDNYPYLRGNGNSLARVGKIIYTAPPLFDSDAHKQFKGYKLDAKGFPTLSYKIGDADITEAYSVKDGYIKRVITSSNDLPSDIEVKGNDKLEITMEASDKTITLTYKSL